jgi:glycosyltransferase involved in cell wall biosynthesis
MPFFSIVIPVYNRSLFIIEAIKSIQNQSFKDWECIVVDDGSTDDSASVIKKLVEEDNRIHYIYQENAERSVARNNGIKNSKGNYICFLDSDDEFLPNHLQVLYNQINIKGAPEALFFTNYILSKLGEIKSQYLPTLKGDVLTYLFYNPIIPARVCIHSAILQEDLFDEEIVIVEDLLLWIRIALKHPVFHIEQSTVVYNIHDDNSVNIQNNAATKRLNGLKVFKKKHPKIMTKIPSKIWNDVFGDTHFNVMKYYIYENQNKLAFKHLFLSIVYQKVNIHFKHKMYVMFNLVLNRTIPEYHLKIKGN